DILSEVPISFVKAALGGEVEIYTIEDQVTGSTTVELKPGTQPGDVIVRRGAGIPRIGHGGRGDHVIQWKVEIPRKLSQKQQDLLRELATDLGEDVKAEKRGLFGRKK
ncbi:MAG: DnaJ C-terminal domain-containing protein, partial [Kofleriaceae bacterium]